MLSTRQGRVLAATIILAGAGTLVWRAIAGGACKPAWEHRVALQRAERRPATPPPATPVPRPGTQGVGWQGELAEVEWVIWARNDWNEADLARLRTLVERGVRAAQTVDARLGDAGGPGSADDQAVGEFIVMSASMQLIADRLAAAQPLPEDFRSWFRGTAIDLTRGDSDAGRLIGISALADAGLLTDTEARAAVEAAAANPNVGQSRSAAFLVLQAHDNPRRRAK